MFFFVNYSHLNHDRNMAFIKEETEDFRIEEVFSQVKSSHLYLYSAFNNTNCDKATAQYQNGKIVSIM